MTAKLITHDLIEELEQVLLQINPAHDQVYDQSVPVWLPLNRENLIKAMQATALRGGQLQFTGPNRDALNATVQRKDTAGKPAGSRWEGFRKFVPFKVLSEITSFSEAALKAQLYDFIEYQMFMQIDMSVVFYKYFGQRQNNLYQRASGQQNLTDDEFVSKYGRAPWDEVNELLQKYGFRHRVVPPSAAEDARAIDGYLAKFISEDGKPINVQELSSGESVIIALLLSAYAAQQKTDGFFHVDAPDIILFDELDAHLHPSMTRMMFDVLSTSIMGKLGSRIILTTHSPSTVALAPAQSLYRLTPGPQHRLDPVDRATASRELSDGFIQVVDGSQIVITEGKDDPAFYRAIERAMRAGRYLEGLPTLHFIPASQTANPSAGGGALSATDWATKLKDANVPNIHALLDNDGHRSATGAIKVSNGRYAIENFILDPLSIAVALITDQKLSAVDGRAGSLFPQVSNLFSSSAADLQMLADVICRYVEARTAGLATSQTVSVDYLGGMQLTLPEWVCKKRGHDLVGIVREAFKAIDPAYIITRKDSAPYDLDLGYLLKLWSQHPGLFPVDLQGTLIQFDQRVAANPPVSAVAVRHTAAATPTAANATPVSGTP